MSDEPRSGVAAKAAYHHGDLRAQLIRAATELVETHGPDGFSVAEAARRAGVSTAAPYKHFKDRDAILRGVVSAAMDRLRSAMETAASRFPARSLEAVAAIGQAYIDFAKAEPGLFRLVFGLTEGHENAPDLLEKGQGCFAVVARAVAERLDQPLQAADVQRRAYLLWSFVHGHSFLTIDRKNKAKGAHADDWAYLMDVSRAIVGPEPDR
jgi:AcrR family transcriptional regulator